MVIHDTECPCWNQVSLNNTKPTHPPAHPSFTQSYIFLPASLLFRFIVKPEPAHTSTGTPFPTISTPCVHFSHLCYTHSGRADTTIMGRNLESLSSMVGEDTDTRNHWSYLYCSFTAAVNVRKFHMDLFRMACMVASHLLHAEEMINSF